MNSNLLLAHPGQSLADHLDGVSRLAEQFASWFEAAPHGQLAGLLHDLGKAEEEFQLQFTFAESLDKALPLDATITRCAVASEKEKKQAEGEAAESSANRTMGRKHGIDYGLYRCHIHFSPAFAAKTRFSYHDLDNFLFALAHMFDDDHAAGRHLRLVGLVDFQHQSALGNAPAHKLFELVKVDAVTKDKDGKKVFASSDSEFPRSLSDYSGESPSGDLHVKDGKVLTGSNGEGVAVIKAKRLIWEIPPKPSDGKPS